MKKTNKTFKRFAAITSASLLAACAMAPVFTLAAEGDDTAPTYSITINNAATGHTYEAYQIFKGDLSVEDDVKILSNIVWGDDVTSSITDKTAAELAETLTEGMTGKEIITALGITIDDTPTGTISNQSDGKYIIPDLAPGYYLIKDADDSLEGEYDAYTSYIIKVVGDAEASPKSAKPSVDKQVYDNADGTAAAGWGETADWTINNNYNGTTQFKLIATIPAETNLADYDSYKLVFNDTMSKGITFDSIASVSVAGYTGDVVYDCTATTGMKGNGTDSWSLTIEDITVYDTNLANGATIEVIYNAHLNEEATITTASGSIVNKNTVDLEYSNNPNWTSSGEGDEEDLGKTPEDSVWVATYKILNTKVDGASWNEEEQKYDTVLENAVFELYGANGKINVKYDTNLGAYRPIAAGETADDVKSATDGTFNFAGLDAGTYTLKEITPPTGYNKLDKDLTITLTATHEEDANKAGQVTLGATGDLGLDNKIENNKGASLPGTGGIGTTIFYLGGGAMAAIGGVYLISKRRMKKSEE